MTEFMQNITTDRVMFTVAIVFVVGGLVALMGIFFGTIRSTGIAKEREKSRREIAAYIAEGSMSAEDGERLMNAGHRPTASELAVMQRGKHA